MSSSTASDARHKPAHRMLGRLVRECGRPRFFHILKDVPKEALLPGRKNMLVVHHAEEASDADYAMLPPPGRTLFCNMLGFLVFPKELPSYVEEDRTIVNGIHPRHYD